MSSLVPIEQKTVAFYDDEITAVSTNAGIYIPVRPICDLLGVAWTGQQQRISRDAVLSQVARGVRITRTPGTGGGTQEMLCLPLDYLNGWLFGINAARVKPAVKDRLIRYQLECYKVLAEAFKEGRLTTEPDFDELLSMYPEEAEAYYLATAVVRMARNQLLIKAQIADNSRRLELIESQLGDESRNISQEQAAQISQAVKTVAIAYGKKTKQNEFGSVYGELYRKFGITSYKMLPAARFNEAMKWLTDWHEDLTSDAF